MGTGDTRLPIPCAGRHVWTQLGALLGAAERADLPRLRTSFPACLHVLDYVAPSGLLRQGCTGGLRGPDSGMLGAPK